jgi:hypothetical protein
MSDQVVQQNQGTESWEDTRALSFIILGIEKASLTKMKHVEWQVTKALAETNTQTMLTSV